MQPPPQPAQPQDFESALAELEDIVAAMEGSQLPLKEALAAYRRGAELVAYCQGALQDAQLQIETLEKDVLKPFVPDGADDDA
jgi:exodeoxyribonuclease VII small subunit